jgi:hypothetical protein
LSGTAAPPLSAPEGSFLALEGRVGGAACGFCGLVLGGAVYGSRGPLLAGAFAEVSAFPAMDVAGNPAELRSAAYLGGVAGTHANVGPRLRIGAAAEGGFELARSQISYEEGQSGPAHGGEAWVPFVGARAMVGLRRPRGEAVLGMAAFVREPLRSTCVDVGIHCDRVGTTVGVVVQLSGAFWRSGAAAGSPSPPTPPTPP